MSRVGRKPITIPPGVDVKIDDGVIYVKKDKTELNQKLHPLVNVEINDNIIQVSKVNDRKESKSLQGLMRSLINNMVTGVNEPSG